jgi:hypothetical protein
MYFIIKHIPKKMGLILQNNKTIWKKYKYPM